MKFLTVVIALLLGGCYAIPVPVHYYGGVVPQYERAILCRHYEIVQPLRYHAPVGAPCVVYFRGYSYHGITTRK